VVLMFEFVRVWRAFWRFKVATVSGSGNAFQTAFDPWRPALEILGRL
jgi:hypothetical protein